MNGKKTQIQKYVYDFFIKSSDYNGIPLRQIGSDLAIPYKETIDIIKELVEDDACMIQSSTNPHIIHSRTYSIPSQIQCLEAAKNLKIEEIVIGDFRFFREDTEYPICVYPTPSFLQRHRNTDGMPLFTKLLALGMPQLTPCYFDMDVLQRYYDDPRYFFFFENYSGRISYKEIEGQSLVRKEDEVFLETFGMGYDVNGERIVVAYLRYLHDLTPEHQLYWQSKMVHPERKPTMLEEYYENTIEGRWVSCESVYTAFQYELNTIIDLSEQIFGKRLFREKISRDKPPKELSFFFLPTKKHFNDFVLAMDQLISENINRDFFAGIIDIEIDKEREDGKNIVTPKGTLTLLREWLEQSINLTHGSIDDLLKPLREIRKLRQTPAHKLSADEYDSHYSCRQKVIIWDAYCSLRNIRTLLAGHPNADSTIVPQWLDCSEIKSY